MKFAIFEYVCACILYMYACAGKCVFVCVHACIHGCACVQSKACSCRLQSCKPRQAGMPVDQAGTPELVGTGALWMTVCHLNIYSMAFASPAIARSPLIQEQCE